MTLQELKESFGSPDDHYYRVLKNKSDLEMLEDAGQSISTISCAGGLFIRVTKEFNHPDYAKVTE